jgi:hypothetical protein
MKRIIALTAVLLCAGCAGNTDGSALAVGQATTADVEKAMGTVAARTTGSNGETVLWFSRQPSGRVIYAARMGKDDRLIGVEQTLVAENLAKIQPGKSTEAEVRAILGPPWRIDPFPRMQRVAWTYAVQGMNPQQYVVQFSSDGVARERFAIDDPDFVRGMAL